MEAGRAELQSQQRPGQTLPAGLLLYVTVFMGDDLRVSSCPYSWVHGVLKRSDAARDRSDEGHDHDDEDEEEEKKHTLHSMVAILIFFP